MSDYLVGDLAEDPVARVRVWPFQPITMKSALDTVWLLLRIPSAKLWCATTRSVSTASLSLDARIRASRFSVSAFAMMCETEPLVDGELARNLDHGVREECLCPGLGDRLRVVEQDPHVTRIVQRERPQCSR